MLVKDFQYINSISGSTNYEELILTHFNISKNQTIEKVQLELESALKINPREIKGNFIRFNKKKWGIEKDLLECTYEQFNRLEMLLAEEKNIENLHKLLAIYVRPRKWFKIEKFNLKRQDDIAKELLELDMNIAQGLILFFYLNATKSFLNINISYLNQMKKPNQTLIQSR